MESVDSTDEGHRCRPNCSAEQPSSTWRSYRRHGHSAKHGADHHDGVDQVVVIHFSFWISGTNQVQAQLVDEDVKDFTKQRLRDQESSGQGSTGHGSRIKRSRINRSKIKSSGIKRSRINTARIKSSEIKRSGINWARIKSSRVERSSNQDSVDQEDQNQEVKNQGLKEQEARMDPVEGSRIIGQG